MSQYICSHCSKCYKSETWFNKHMKTHETKTEAPIKQVITQADNTDKKPYLKTEKFLDTDFLYTIKGVKTGGDKYYSPQQAAIENKTIKKEVVIAKGKMLKSGKEGKSNIDKLDTQFKNNNHLYEVLDDERKFHLDIEFPDMGIDENNKIICSISKLLIIGFRKISMKITLILQKLLVLVSLEHLKGLKKCHIILF